MPGYRQRVEPRDLGDYLEMLTLAIFKSGLSLSTVEAKWDGFERAFDGFDPKRVAAFGPEKVEELSRDESIVRARAKIQATVDNARIMVELDREHGGFGAYLESLGGPEARRADLKKRFAFVGDATASFFLSSVGKG